MENAKEETREEKEMEYFGEKRRRYKSSWAGKNETL